MNWGNPEPAAPPRAAAALRVDTSTGFWRAGHEVLGGFFFWFGSVSKPCTPGEPQNSWYMDVHPTKNGINRYWSIPIPIGSMYAIYGNIYHQYTPNVSIYTIHGSYGIWTMINWPFTKATPQLRQLRLCQPLGKALPFSTSRLDKSPARFPLGLVAGPLP